MDFFVRRRRKSVETSALLNSGFESEANEIVLPTRLAEKLGLWPSLPEKAEIKEYETAGGGKVKVIRVPNIKVFVGEKESDAYRIIIEEEREVIMNDKLISSLGIVIEDAGKGLWKFRGENKIRKSSPKKIW